MKNLFLINFAILVLVLTTNAQVPGYVPTGGLVGWWPFNGNANDESGNGGNGTANGAVLTIDRFGNLNKAYNFDGISNYITASPANLPLSNSDISISAWFNSQAFPSGQSNGVVSWGQWTTNNARYMGFRQGFNNKLTYAQYFNDVNCTFNYSLNTWYHYVITYSNNNANFYINGALIGTFSISTPNTINGPLFFGKSSGTGDYFTGSLDDIGVWNRALSLCEVQQLYNSLTVVASNTAICSGESVFLSATGPANYTWQPSGAVNVNIQVSPFSNTTYSATSTTTSNCVLSSSIFITVNPKPIVNVLIVPSVVLCVGQSATLIVSGASNYTWQPGGITGSIVVVTPTASTIYNLLGIDSFGCSGTNNIVLNVSMCTGMNQFSKNEELFVYPNPNAGSFIIGVNGCGNLILSDGSGRIIKNIELTEEAHHRLQMNDLPEGLYLLSGNIGGTRVNRKLIIAK